MAASSYHTGTAFASILAEARRNAAAAATIVLLGGTLIVIPVSGREASVQLTAWILLAAALLEFLVGLSSSRSSVRRIELLLSGVTVGAVLLILFRPEAYPLTIVATMCLAVRGVGATVAAFEAQGVVRGWVLARGAADLVLTTILIVGAPVAAVISVISGVPWPTRGAEVLTNFIAVSVIATGISLFAMTIRNGSRRDA